MVCDVDDDLGLFFYAGYTCGFFKMHQFLVSSQKKKMTTYFPNIGFNVLGMYLSWSLILVFPRDTTRYGSA